MICISFSLERVNTFEVRLLPLLPTVSDRKIIRENNNRVICPPPSLPPFHYLAFLRFPRIRSWLPGNVVEPKSKWLAPYEKSELTNRY